LSYSRAINANPFAQDDSTLYKQTHRIGDQGSSYAPLLVALALGLYTKLNAFELSHSETHS